MKSIIPNFKIHLNKAIILILCFLAIKAQGSIGLENLTLEQKIGQMIIIPACELRGDDHFEDLQRLIQKGWVGGILLKQGTAEGQRSLIERLQKLSPVPLLCVQDGEWGVAMRLTDVISFPRNLTLGAVQDLALLYQLGQEIGKQCKLVGAHLDLAPVVDVNCNPRNPIIHMRSFGEDPSQVAKRGEKVMRGIQSTGVMACAKHFPGHGDTATDSHVDLPIIGHDAEHLQKVELIPFQKLINANVQAILTAHLYVKALAEVALLPATFSHQIVTDLLQKKMGFRGLVLTDALNMKALAKHYSPGEIAIKATIAGHDMLLYGDHIAPNIDQILRNDIPQAIAALKSAVEKGEISEELIDSKVSKILQAKEKCGLFKPDLKIENVTGKINSSQAYALKKKLFEEAITVVRNEGVLPLQKSKIAIVEWGQSPVFKMHFEADVFSLIDPELLLKMQDYSCIVLALSGYTNAPPDFNLGAKELAQLTALSKKGIPCVAVVFGTPYSLSALPLFDAIVVAYENELEAQEAAAQVLLGHLSPKGHLPVSVLPHFPLGTGISWKRKIP